MKNGKLRVADGVLSFYCTGCKRHHAVNIDPSKSPSWSFNGDYENPTFSPSVNISNSDVVCHSFVADGQIQYLSDCTHQLAGKTIELE